MQAHLVQSEKMASLGQLVEGLTHLEQEGLGTKGLLEKNRAGSQSPLSFDDLRRVARQVKRFQFRT